MLHTHKYTHTQETHSSISEDVLRTSKNPTQTKTVQTMSRYVCLHVSMHATMCAEICVMFQLVHTCTCMHACYACTYEICNICKFEEILSWQKSTVKSMIVFVHSYNCMHMNIITCIWYTCIYACIHVCINSYSGPSPTQSLHAVQNLCTDSNIRMLTRYVSVSVCLCLCVCPYLCQCLCLYRWPGFICFCTCGVLSFCGTMAYYMHANLRMFYCPQHGTHLCRYHTSTHLQIHTHEHTNLLFCPTILTHTYICTYIHTCMYTYIRYTHKYLYTYQVYTYIQTGVHTYTHTHTHRRLALALCDTGVSLSL